MKRKIYLLLLTVAIFSLLAVTFAFTASAEEISVTYNWIGGYQYDVAAPNEDGSYTLRTNKQSGDGTVSLADGTVVEKEFYGWFDEAGNLYAPGETVFFTESTKLYEAYGVTVNNEADFMKVCTNSYVKLGADITLTSVIQTWWHAYTINLNGYTLTSTASSIASIQRASFIVHGPGKLVHEPATLKTGIDECAVYIYAHGYGDDDAPQQFWIGKGVELTTPYSALRCGSVAREKHPKIAIAGTVNARALARISPVTTEATCKIYDTAIITTSVSFIEFANQTGVNKYMDMTIDGTINVANGEGSILTEFVLAKADVSVKGGKFCVTQSDIDNIKYYLPDNLMAVQKVEGDLTWTEFVLSDCVHEWVKNAEASIEPTPTDSGKDFLVCSNCGAEKIVVTVYDPSNVEITITVRAENGIDTDVTVKLGEVFELATTGVGDKTKFSFASIIDSEKYPASSIVAIEIPFGVSVINVTAVNESLETINIADGANVKVVSVAGFKALKTINIGAAEVEFVSVSGNSSLETVSSKVAGATVTFSKQCFDGKSNIKYLEMANGSTYKFGENSFRKTGVETLIFPDEATVEFVGGAAFYNAAVKYAYFGKSITSINNKPLDCANDLELVVIMGATYIDQYCFCVSAATNATSVVKVYCHSEKVSIHRYAFVNRQNYGVEFYTIDPSIQSLSDCTYVVYNGIPHAYAEGIIKEPTCIETGLAGSTTDCVCNVNEVVTYTVYTADGSAEYTTAQREIPLSDIHVISTNLIGINYKDGYLSLGTKEYSCALCGVATVEEVKPSADAIIKYYGYSASTYGKPSVVQSYGINNYAYNEYRSFNTDFIIGAVLVANPTGEATQPLTIENGAVKSTNEKAVVAIFDATLAVRFDIKVTGFSESQKDKTMVFCLYTFNGESLGYVENGNTVGSVVGTTYNAIVAE